MITGHSKILFPTYKIAVYCQNDRSIFVQTIATFCEVITYGCHLTGNGRFMRNINRSILQLL